MKIPVYQPYIDKKEKEYVNDCLDSTWISSKGKYIELFENSFKDFIGVKYASAVSNGTVALHLALLAAGITKDDEVIVPTFTYIASVNAVSYTGAKPVFVDCSSDTWQMDSEDIIKKITNKTKVILVVHLYGHPCEMDEICRIADEKNIIIIEDCAEAIGSKFNNQMCGTFGLISTFSFFGNKTITTGEGGMVLTNDELINKKINHLKGQGLADKMEYWHDIIGYNYRMTNICAAIGFAQMERVLEIIDKKILITNFYKNELNDTPIIFHTQKENCFHTYWMNTILCKNAEERNALRRHLELQNIETRPTFHPIHLMPMYFKDDINFPISENISSRGINLPSYPELSNEELIYICTTIKSFFR